MNNAYEIKNGIIKYSVLFTSACFVISVFIIGFNSGFAWGMLIGTLAALLNMNLLYVFLNASLIYALGFAFNFLGYIVRLSIYGAAIYIALKIGISSVFGMIISFFMIKLSIYFINIKKIKKEKQL